MREVKITPELEKSLDTHLERAKEFHQRVSSEGKLLYTIRVGGCFRVEIGDFVFFSLDDFYTPSICCLRKLLALVCEKANTNLGCAQEPDTPPTSVGGS